MRLSRPTLVSNEKIQLDPWDLAGQLDSSSLSSEICGDSNEISPLGMSMLLPQSFG